MQTSSPSLAEHTFKAGTEYDLVVFDRLAVEEQALLAELRADAGFYGILRPREGNGRTIRAVDRDTALLWLGAQTPGRLPFFVWDGVDRAVAERRVAQLVLDGVLEIELGGEFVSGPRAVQILPRQERSGSGGRIRAVSEDALRYGASLKLEDRDDLASRLYGFGAVPLSPAWTQRLTDSSAVLAYLGASPGTALAHRLASEFGLEPARENTSWISWSRPSRRAPGPSEPTYKLYVSPQPDDLPSAFRELVEVLTEHNHLQFKVGGSAPGVLRPDKLVVYFEGEESLQCAADALRTRLTDLTPQGVPFSAEIALDGLLSWGMDPPRNARALTWQGHDSWRIWIVHRLAAAVVAAQREGGGGVDASRYALERLRLDGLDVEGWAPSTRKWWLE